MVESTFLTTWPVVVDMVRQGKIQTSEKKLIEEIGGSLISFASAGQNFDQMLNDVLTNSPGHLDLFKKEGGWIGLWTRVLLQEDDPYPGASNTLDTLIAYGADIEQPDSRGHSALEQVASFADTPLGNEVDIGKRCKDMVDILLMRGAQWRFIQRRKYPQAERIFISHPRIKSELLTEIANHQNPSSERQEAPRPRI